MRYKTTSCSQNTLRSQHSMHVLRRCLVAHQYDFLSSTMSLYCSISSKIHSTDCRTRRGTQAVNEDIVITCRKLRMQHLLQMASIYPSDSLPGRQGNIRFGNHIHRHLQCSPSRALAYPGLKHPEFALLYGKLRITHIAIMSLQACKDIEQFVVDIRHPILQCRQGHRITDTCYDILTLGVYQEISIRSLLPCRRISGKTDTST